MPVAAQLPVDIVEPQGGLGIVVSGSTALPGGAFGMVGALVGAAFKSSKLKSAQALAEVHVTPLRELMDSYPFNQNMQAALRNKVPSEGISPAPVFTVLPGPVDGGAASERAQVPSLALVLTPGYSIDGEFKMLTISLRAEVVDRSSKPSGKASAVPRAIHTYQYVFTLLGERSADGMRDWQAFDASGLAALLDMGIAQVTDMLVYDFSVQGREMWAARPPAAVSREQARGWIHSGKGLEQFIFAIKGSAIGVPPLATDLPFGATPPSAPAAETAPQISNGDESGTGASESVEVEGHH